MLQRVSLAHQTQDGGHLVGLGEVLHDGIDGVHDAPCVLPQLAALLHLLRVLHVLELAEVLLGRWEVHKEPAESQGAARDKTATLLLLLLKFLFSWSCFT